MQPDTRPGSTSAAPGDARPDGPTTVYLVDDHELIRRGLRDLIQFESDLVVVGEAPSVAMAVRDMAQNPPDVAVLDLILTDGTGIDVCRRVRSRHPSVAGLIITSLDDTTALQATVLSGAVGYLAKLAAGSELVQTIRRTRGNPDLLDPALRAAGRADLQTSFNGSVRLNEHDRMVARLVLDGLSDREIGARLDRSEDEASAMVSGIVDKIALIRTRATLRSTLAGAR